MDEGAMSLRVTASSRHMAITEVESYLVDTAVEWHLVAMHRLDRAGLPSCTIHGKVLTNHLSWLALGHCRFTRLLKSATRTRCEPRRVDK